MATFRAMNTDVAVIVDDADDAGVTAAAARTFAAAEARFSRFRPDSELSRLNRAVGPVVVSRELFDALVAARGHVVATGGIFDPAIGGALIALGYDRSFTPGALDRAVDGAAAPRGGGFLDVALDPATRQVARPPGVVIDLGGMMKGRTVDAAAAWLPPSGAIDAGGDAALRGDDDAGDGWLIEIEDPRDPARTTAIVRVRGGAVATSAANRRRWQVGGAARHHLVDPRTQRSAATDLLQATVFAPTAELADVLAKCAFVLGAAAAPGLLARWPEVGAVLVPATGRPIVHGTLDVQGGDL